MGMESLFNLLGGLALFLYGMQMMSSGLENAAGNRMQRILERLTANRFLGVAVGAGITAVIQSSSATTVMVVGFVNSGMMTLQQAVWIIMGANIGTTITGQLIALDVGAMAPVFAFLGVVMIVFLKRPIFHHYGDHCRFGCALPGHGDDERSHGSPAGVRGIHRTDDALQQSRSGNFGGHDLHGHYPVFLCLGGYSAGSGRQRPHRPFQRGVCAVRSEHRHMHYRGAGFHRYQPQRQADYHHSFDVQSDRYGDLYLCVHDHAADRSGWRD